MNKNSGIIITEIIRIFNENRKFVRPNLLREP